jgi:hypothetical protein
VAVLIFLNNRDRIVDPVELEATVTPDAVSAAVEAREWVEAIGMALRLERTETEVVLVGIGRMLEAIPERARTKRAVELFVRRMRALLRFHPPQSRGKGERPRTWPRR